MSTPQPTVPAAGLAATHWRLALFGLAAMYLPSYWSAWQGLWQTDQFGHAPLVLLVCVWVAWQARKLAPAAPALPAPALGWSLLTVGVLMYAVGRMFGISSIEFASQPLVVAGVVLVLEGAAALRRAWFAVAFLVFMVPLPATLIDAVTGPLKNWVSVIVVELLHWAGYPIARTGVMISVGPYQLLVADACSGLQSMISLSALGTLFVYLRGRRERLHNLVMLACILPVAFVANIVRVVVLVLITYHLGDEAGQGFLHGTAGMVLMLAALAGLWAIDALLAMARRPRAARSAGPSTPAPTTVPSPETVS